MPCFCWIDDSEIEPEMVEIRKHAKEIVRLAKIANGKGDLYSKSGPIPREIMDDIHQLLNDYWNGKCSEGKEMK